MTNSVEVEEGGLQHDIKTVEVYHINEQGERVKVTRKIKLHLTKKKTNHGVAVRSKWAQFGSAKNKISSIEDGMTSLGEELFLKLSSGKTSVLEEPILTIKERVQKKQSSMIACRSCGGDHWTNLCPLKDVMQSNPGGSEGDGREGSKAGDGLKSAAAAPSSGVYVAPRRAAALANGGTMLSALEETRRLEELSTVRVTNLSEDTKEPDVRDLFCRFGPIKRVFLARHMETNTCKGFAFVNFESRNDAQAAIEKMNGKPYANLILQVEWSKPSTAT